MINFKDLNISNIYNGQTEVSALYLGSTKIYPQNTLDEDLGTLTIVKL